MKNLISSVKVLMGVLFLTIYGGSYGQETERVSNTAKVRISAYDGILAVGYVDGGGYSNFTGPNINMTYGHSK